MEDGVEIISDQLGWKLEQEFLNDLEKRHGIVRKISTSINAQKTAIIFGSTAREVIKPDSDLDLIIVIDKFADIGSSDFFPKIGSAEIASLPNTVTNLSFELEIEGTKTHIEVYTKEWLEKLLVPEPVGTHQTAIYDPDHQRSKKDIGHWSTFTKKIVQFPRNQQRNGNFLVFDDYEPKEEDGLSLRIEQKKVAYCFLETDELNIAPAIETTQDYIRSSAVHFSKRNVSIGDLAHAFTREKSGTAIQLRFSPNALKRAGKIYEQKEKEPIPLPDSLRLSLTNKCNLRCVYCMGEGNRPESLKEGKTLEPERFDKIVDYWVKLGGKRLKFTGGEPFLNPDIEHFFQIGKQRGLSMSITTNGYFLTERNLVLLKLYGVGLIVSLDTLAEGEKSKMSPVGAISAKRIAAKIIAAKETGIKVEVNTVLTAINKESVLNDMVPWALSHQVPLRVLEEGEVIPGNTSGSVINLVAFAKQVAEIYGMKIVNRGIYKDLIAIKDKDPVVFFLSSFCGNGDCESCHVNSIRVTAEGEAVPCMKEDTRIPLNSADDLKEALRIQKATFHDHNS